MKILVVTNMYPIPENPGYGCFVKSQVQSLQEKGVRADLVFANGKYSRGEYVRGAWRVFRKSLSGSYDLVHAHYGLSGMLALCQRRSPVVVSFCGSDVLDPAQRRISRVVSRWADLSIVKSRQLGSVLGTGNIRVIPNGLDLTLFRPIDRAQARRMLNLDRDARYILFAADPTRQVKRVDVARRTYEMVKDRLPDPVELLILHGRNPTEVPLYMNACDVLLLTSDWEGSPNVVKEALACDLPIVSTDVGDVREMTKGTCNCHVCPQAPESLSEKILLVFKDGHRSDGREKVFHLSLENIADTLIDAYRQLVARRGRRGR